MTISTKINKPANKLDLNIMSWLNSTIFDSIWKTVFAIALIILNILIVRAGFRADPVGLSSYSLTESGQPNFIGNIILIITNGALLTSLILILWFAGAGAVIYSVSKHHWPGPTQWLKDSLYTGPFGALITLPLTMLIVFTVRSILAWAVFGAEFSTNPEVVALLKSNTPGAIWGIVFANPKLFTVGQYPMEHIWRVFVSIGFILILAILSSLAWSFGSPLKQIRKPLVWSWLISIAVIYILLKGVTISGIELLPIVPTLKWGGFLLTIVLSVVGIVVSFPIGVMLALGRRSEIRGVPLLWLWGTILLLFYWMMGNFPTEAITLNIPIIFRTPPIWKVTLSLYNYAILQAIIVIAPLWLIDHYLQGNIIKTLSIVYIEIIRGVPFITVLFMANIMIPIFLPKGVEIDNLLRVIIGTIMFSAAYQAENVRGGLQAIPKGQYEAAMALGLSTAQSMRLIILPQALRVVIPAIVGFFITLFKDTTLVAIVGIFDLLLIAKTVVSQSDWLGLQKETYAFVALIYWIFAFSMSRASQRLERKLGVGQY